MTEVSDVATIVIGYDGSDAARSGLAQAGRLSFAAIKVVPVDVARELGAELVIAEHHRSERGA